MAEATPAGQVGGERLREAVRRSSLDDAERRFAGMSATADDALNNVLYEVQDACEVHRVVHAQPELGRPMRLSPVEEIEAEPDEGLFLWAPPGHPRKEREPGVAKRGGEEEDRPVRDGVATLASEAPELLQPTVRHRRGG